ncbi:MULTISPECIES: hypothetical protein [unclassified Chryseobacterium]|uniref:hypothetical protein n=1 Tax=unclassified Chryseobacterium TaxID=2593645 RepID=UPI000D358CD4|nr:MULTISPECIES: hypothetical protein [unclassified Chryseobacterium]PTT73099.1 hypothetical protein DBR25_13655 [Chryseobacterium sp. HMWF001]PVV50778.1 hypothetical protein DD829_21480 [Chryseobacterium sp. HMWF035]
MSPEDYFHYKNLKGEEESIVVPTAFNKKEKEIDLDCLVTTQEAEDIKEAMEEFERGEYLETVKKQLGYKDKERTKGE